MRMIKHWKRWVDLSEKIVINLAAGLMLLMAVLVTYQVFARYVLHDSPFWIEEICTTVLMWVGLLAAACATWTDSHMDLEMVVMRLPKVLQLWLRVVSDLLIAGFAGYLVKDGIILVQNTMAGMLSTLPVPIGYTYLVLPVVGALMIVFALTKAVNRLVSFYVYKEEYQAQGVNFHE